MGDPGWWCCKADYGEHEETCENHKRMDRMKEKPILFSGEMVRAILSGKKTQTRRLVKYIPALGEPDDWAHKRNKHSLIGDYRKYCPYGTPKNFLWVRETWASHAKYDHLRPKDIPLDAKLLYRASGAFHYEEDETMEYEKWRPSIHMPRWAARINLEITGVRVERLHDITIEDALSEGIHHNPMNCPRIEFAWLWDSINEESNGWSVDPLVWVVEFELVK